MFKRDIHTPTLANLLQPKLLYLGDKSSLLLTEVLRGLHVGSNNTQNSKR